MQQLSVPPSHIDQILDRHGFYVLAGGHNQPVRHWHRGIELILVHTGTVELFAKTGRCLLRPGEISFYAAHSMHGASGNFNRTVIHFVADLLPSGANPKLQHLLDTEKSFRISPHPESVSRLIWAAQELLKLSVQRWHMPTAQALMGLVLAEVEVSLNNPWEPASYDLLQAIIEYMRASVASDETLDVLAAKFQISKGHLHRLFVGQLRCSPRQYWLALKLDSACSLLQANEAVQNIASAIGFLSVRGFEQAFQRAYAMSPSEYRLHTQLRSADPNLLPDA